MIVFRRLFYKLVPSWLSSGEGEKVLASMGAMKDMALERMRQGMIQRFPSYAGNDALRLIGKDRKIPRGRTEPRDHYVQRLKGWRFPTGHRTRGSAFGLLEQVSEYFGGLLCYTRDDKGNLHKRTADGTESFSYGQTFNWDGQGKASGGSLVSRFWLVLFPQPSIPSIQAWPELDAGPWGDSLDDNRTDNVILDCQGVTTFDIQALQDFFRRTLDGVVWKPAATRAMWAVVSMLDEADTPAIVPDGTWDTWHGRFLAPDVLRFWSLK